MRPLTVKINFNQVYTRTGSEPPVAEYNFYVESDAELADASPIRVVSRRYTVDADVRKNMAEAVADVFFEMTKHLKNPGDTPLYPLNHDAALCIDEALNPTAKTE